MTHPIMRLLMLGCALLLADCSGGGGQGSVPSGSLASAGASFSHASAGTQTSTPQIGGTTTSVPTPQTISAPASSGSSVTNTQPVPVQFTYTLSASTTATTGSQGLTRRVLANANYVGYTSTAAPISISLNVTPVGGSTSNYTGSCTAASTGTSGTCTVTGFTAAPGPTTIAGTVTESGNTIASFSNLTIIQPTTVNNVNFTANPVVASVAVVLSAPTTYLNTTLNQTLPAVDAGTAYDVPVVVNAYDANGKVIAGTKNYVDSTGTPVSLILSVNNSQAGGRGTVFIKGPSRITAPGQAAIYAHYDGNWLNYSTISVAATSRAVTTSGANTTLTTIPYATEYTAASHPDGIVSGPDGNLWFTEYGGHAIGQITTSGIVTAHSCSPCSNPHTITVGPDGRLWIGESIGNYIDALTTSWSFSRIFPLPGNIVSLYSFNGSLWYARWNNNTIGSISTSGLSTFTFSAGHGSASFGLGLDGSLWETTNSGTSVSHFSPSGTLLGTVAIDNVGSAGGGIVASPDGNIWIANYGSSELDRITPSLGLTVIHLQAGAAPQGITIGPDGNLWFAEYGTNTLGYITPTGTTPVEFSSLNGISGTSAPKGITLGSDGNIWFTEYGNNKIAKFVF